MYVYSLFRAVFLAGNVYKPLAGSELEYVEAL